MVVWIASHPSTVLDYDIKCLSLVVLVTVPGKYFFEWLFKTFGWQQKLVERLSLMGFVGLSFGIIRAVYSASIGEASLALLSAFVAASLMYLVLDVSFEWLDARYRRRRN